MLKGLKFYVNNVNTYFHLSPETIKSVFVVTSRYLFEWQGNSYTMLHHLSFRNCGSLQCHDGWQSCFDAFLHRLCKCRLFPSSFTFATEELKCHKIMIITPWSLWLYHPSQHNRIHKLTNYVDLGLIMWTSWYEEYPIFKNETGFLTYSHGYFQWTVSQISPNL